MNSHQKPFAFFVLLMTLAAFLFRVYRLDYFSLRGDEAFTVLFVQRTWEGLWRGISTIEPNPPLMYLMLRAWIALAGAGEFAVRFFSAFFGVLSVPLLYRLARVIASPKGARQSQSNLRIASPHPSTRSESAQDAPRNDMAQFTALFAATLLAINPYQIWHSQDVRNYTLWPALSLAALIFFWRWWGLEVGNWKLENGKPNYYLPITFYVLFSIASLYTHYYDVFILVAQNIFVLAFSLAARQWRTLGRWVIAQIALVVMYAPWVLFGTNRITTYGEASAERGVSLLEQFSRAIATFTASATVPENFHALIWVPAALGLVVVLVGRARADFSHAAFLFLWIAVPTLALYAISLGRPLFHERYLNGIAPAYYLAFAVGLGVIYPPRATWHLPVFYLAMLGFALVSAYALANYWYNPIFAKAPDWRGLSQFINANLRLGDIIVQNFNEVSVQYYRTGDAPVITLPRDYWWRAEDEQTLARVNREYRRIWFIPAQPDWWDPEQDAQKFLSRYADRDLERDLSVFHLQLFSTPRAFEPRMTRVDARIGSAELAGYRVQKLENAWRVVLYWRPAEKSGKDLHVFMHLADLDGRVIAQSDGVPVEGAYPTAAWKPGELIVDAREIKSDASGTFTLVAGMYDPSTGARAPVFDANGVRQPDDRLILTPITLP